MFKKKTEIVVHRCTVRLFEDFTAVEYEFLVSIKVSSFLLIIMYPLSHEQSKKRNKYIRENEEL